MKKKNKAEEDNNKQEVVTDKNMTDSSGNSNLSNLLKQIFLHHLYKI